jgi:hypothetical protein
MVAAARDAPAKRARRATAVHTAKRDFFMIRDYLLKMSG